MTYEEADAQLHAFLTVHRNAARRFFQSRGLFNGHPAVLFHIGSTPGITQGQLAERLQVAPATVAVSLRRMEAAGLIRRTADEEDRRVVRLTLTEQGTALNACCLKGKELFVRRQFAGFSEEELQCFCGYLRRIEENLTPTEEEKEWTEP